MEQCIDISEIGRTIWPLALRIRTDIDTCRVKHFFGVKDL